jgi:hypothetical protein
MQVVTKQMQALTKQCAEILHQNSILATVQSFQAGFWRDLARPRRIASEISVQTVASDLFWRPWCFWKQGQGSAAATDPFITWWYIRATSPFLAIPVSFIHGGKRAKWGR